MTWGSAAWGEWTCQGVTVFAGDLTTGRKPSVP